MNLVARFDLDKTYLRSEFATVQDLMRSALERADQKRAVPGATELLHELSRSRAYVHVLSGSPRQLRTSIRLRLMLDGVTPDRLTLKPNLKNLLRLRLRSLRDQLGYKLLALLSASEEEKKAGRAAPDLELLVGDDSESDAFIYSLYADILEGSLPVEQLREILEAGELYPDELEQIIELAGHRYGAGRPGATLILIHLANQSAPSEFAMFGPRLFAFFNYAQAAFILLERGVLDVPATLRVTRSLTQLHRFDDSALSRSYWDLARRGLVTAQSLEALRDTSARVDWVQELEDLLKVEPFGREIRRFEANYKLLAGRHRTRQNRA